METFAKLLEALAALLWPVIVVATFFVFRKTISRVIEGLLQGKVKLRFGDRILSIEEVTQEDRRLIADLQAQVIELKSAIRAVVTPSRTPSSVSMVSKVPTRLLWVDDNPNNNSYFAQQLESLGVRVDLVISTAQGRELFSKNSYDFVISDMARKEDDSVKPKAGLEFLQWVRQWNRDIPFVIFCSNSAARHHASVAKELGATGITSSETELFELLKINELRERI